MEAAFSTEGTPEIPVVICYESVFIRDHWTQLTDLPWWYRFEPDIDRQIAWQREIIEKTGQDWFVLPGGYSSEDREQLRIEVEDGQVYKVNRNTGEEIELQEPGISGLTSGAQHAFHPDHLPMSHEELDQEIPSPNLSHPLRLRTEGCFDLSDRMMQEFGTGLMPSGAITSPIWGCYSIWGFEGVMTMVAEHPDIVAYACDRVLQQSLPGIRQAAEKGVRTIWIEECLTDMISPKAFKAINLPLVRQIIEEIRSCGMLSIYYYCGNPAGKWDLLLDAGADALSLEESKKGFNIDIEEVISIVDGRCTVLGNLDAIGVLQNGSEGSLKNEIARQVKAGRRNKNRFIMSIGSPVTPDTSPARVRRYCDLAREIGSPI